MLCSEYQRRKESRNTVIFTWGIVRKSIFPASLYSPHNSLRGTEPTICTINVKKNIRSNKTCRMQFNKLVTRFRKQMGDRYQEVKETRLILKQILQIYRVWVWSGINYMCTWPIDRSYMLNFWVRTVEILCSGLNFGQCSRRIICPAGCIGLVHGDSEVEHYVSRLIFRRCARKINIKLERN
jgi:hypothetical protein